MGHGDARVADDAGERAKAHDARALALGDAGRLVELVIGEALAAAHHLARRGPQRDEMAFDALAGRGRDAAGDARDVHRRHARRKRLDQIVGQHLGPAEARVVVDEPDAQRMDDEGEAIDARLARLQVADGGRPVQPGHQVEIGVLAEGRVGVGAQGHHDGLDGRRRPAAEFSPAVERGHHRDDDVDAPLAQVGQIFLGGPIDDDRLAFQLGRGIAPDGADVAGQDVGPLERGGVARLGRAARQGVEAVEGGVLELIERWPGGLLQRAAAADEGQGGQVEVDDGVGVAQVGRATPQSLGQPVVVEARHHEDALLGEDARLGAVGQDDPPALQPGADAGAIDDEGLLGHGGQRRAGLVRPSRRPQLQRHRQAFQADSIDLAVIFLDERPRSFGIAAATGATHEQFVAHEGVVGCGATFTGMNDKDLFHCEHLM